MLQLDLTGRVGGGGLASPSSDCETAEASNGYLRHDKSKDRQLQKKVMDSVHV